jgi:hypothetical protein
MSSLPKETHNKIDLAIEQLETALFLFLERKSYVSALTLAGAAEEILGMAAKIKGIENSLQESYRVTAVRTLNARNTITD